MSRTVTVAAVQMDARPHPTGERLGRAREFVAQAAAVGAQLVVLPELFNTGYDWSDANYTRAEPMDGPTVAWMRQTAAAHGVHLAGSILLLSEEDIYNALLLVAPDGRLWRYDKNYPAGVERAYFREGRTITIADTDLGMLGMMICWDVAHPELWARYAGQVDLMVITSCPPDPKDFLGGRPSGANAPQKPDDLWFTFLPRQAACLGVPFVNATGSGLFETTLPLPRLIARLNRMMALAGASLPIDPDDARLTGHYGEATIIVGADGRILAQVPTGEGYVVTGVTLADAPPEPQGRQPRFGLSLLTYLMDAALQALLIPVYRRGVRAAHGACMAPVDQQTKGWLAVLAVAGALAAAFGVLVGRRR